MNKPISMTINETRLSLLNVLNTSNLPPCILEMIIKDLYSEAKQLSTFQLKQDTETYNRAQEDAKLQVEKENNKQEAEQQTITEPS